MKTLIKSLSLIIAFVFIGIRINAQVDFISAADFVKSAKSCVIISAQSEKNYGTSHITNSVYLNHKDLYKTTGPEGVLKTPNELAKILGDKGISEKSLIVVYDDGDNKYAGRIYWILKYLGAPNVKVLHKDMNAWRAVRVPITKNPSSIKKTTFTPKVNNNIYASYELVKSSINNASVVIVDVRALSEYNGTSTDPVSKGHLPGAKHLEWKEVTAESGALLSNDQLTKLFNSKQITKDKTIILYCATSVRAGIVFMALQNLGFTRVKVYDGAYNEWVDKGGEVKK